MASGITNAIGKSKLQEKDVTITQNGTFQVSPDSGYDGMAQVVIDTTNLFSVLEGETDQEQANEYILSGVSGY